MKISRQAYSEMFGPTVGDRVRLADTALFDLRYGEEDSFSPSTLTCSATKG